MARYGANIRRIAKTEELEELIRKAEQRVSQAEKAVILAQRGIGYLDPVTGNTLSQSGTPGTTSATNGGFQTGFSANTKDSGRDDTTRDGDDLLSGADAPAPGEQVGAIELKDCDTGERIDVRFDTAFNNEGGDSPESIFKHPIGFDDGDSVPATQTWTNGILWEATASGTPTQGYHPLEAVEKQLIELDSASPSEAPHQLVGFTANDAGATITNPDPDRYTVEYSRAVSANFTGNVTAVQCDDIEWQAIDSLSLGEFVRPTTLTGLKFEVTSAGTTSGSEPSWPDEIGQTVMDGTVEFTAVEDRGVCPIADPQDVKWPPNEPHQLAYDAEKGGFFSSKYDEDIPIKFKRPTDEYQTGMDKLELCTPSGDPVVVQTLENGGWAFFADNGTGDPDVTQFGIQQYNEKGEFVGIISEDRYNFLAP